MKNRKAHGFQAGARIVTTVLNVNSTSGFLAPVHHFLTNLREAPASFAGNIVFAGDHREVIKGVYEGKYDLGATDNQDLAWIMKEENIPDGAFRILWTSDLIPGAPVCVRSGLAPEVKAEIQRALIAFSADREGAKALLIGGFEAASDRDYQGVKSMYQFAL